MVIAIPRHHPPPPATDDDLAVWFTDALPDDWYEGSVDVRHDNDEILVVGDLGPPRAGLNALEQIGAFREATRDQRMAIADGAQAEFRRRVSWGARAGETEVRFTTANVPVMTRLRIEERQILDTLVDGNVARSRSEALAWCVRLVAEHEADWITELRGATEAMNEVRAKGPDAR
jgi:hypothetical protein